MVDIVHAIFGNTASARRSISWVAKDTGGNSAQNANGQATPSYPDTNKVLYPQVVVREKSLDQLELTQHPIERGAAITDHAFKRPAQVEIQAGWSYQKPIGDLLQGDFSIDTTYLQGLYDTILQLQAQRNFVTLVTSKRLYKYLLVEAIGLETDEKTENILGLSIHFQEILIAVTQTVSFPDASVMKQPEINAATTNQGNTSLMPGDKANTDSINKLIPASLQPAVG